METGRPRPAARFEWSDVNRARKAAGKVNGVLCRGCKCPPHTRSVIFLKSLPYQGEDAYRSTRTAFQLGGSDHNDSPVRRSMIKIRDVFQLVQTVSECVVMHREVFGRAVIKAEGVDPEP